MSQSVQFDLVGMLFIIRLVPLMVAGFVSTRNRNTIGMLICILYICVTTVNYAYKNPALNAVFSTPLVFLTSWYIIRDNRRLHIIRFKKSKKE